ncbi:bifunctional [glutamate--ammonia ligase]-adenylyl-L-tyrosine phosphorylase/[glutamate--ammonia-ligase] adenylyltransferase [Idiomarina xiamenensis]|nr:bifunctional [glutamate--ammonia ligase]-adenylyl-L-tyrosine phosphorylase/[glutamate--ammonia-ligase] adenylyltransferase [Idiomarina xiamenensis]
MSEHQQQAAQLAWQRWCEQADTVASWPQARQQQWQQLLSLSPFLARVTEQQAQPFAELVEQCWPQLNSPDRYATTLQRELAECHDEKSLQRLLRQYRQRWMGYLAALDMAGELALADSLAHYTAIADAMIQQALDWHYRRFCQRYGSPSLSTGEAQPLLVLGMGKLGGRELNFSSDIDLIFVYPEQGEVTSERGKRTEHSVFFTRLAQALIAALDQQTGDGQVFRVDMRLRPFGQSGPLVASMAAIEHYYQEQGRDWERYAMVKARLINPCGDYQQQLDDLLRPFVYRRYIDFSAIEALRKMKVLISQEARRQGLRDNIKLGQGGIREIEFIAQSFQLIRGGRERRLQTRSLYQALTEIAELNLLEPETVANLRESYEFLRKLEHHLQQIDDQQTQTLPADDDNRQRLLVLYQCSQWSQLMSCIDAHMARVHGTFQQVIGDAPDTSEEQDSQWQVLWQDMLEEEAALDILSGQGVQDGEAIWKQVSVLREEARRRGSGPRGRKAMATLVPLLLDRILLQQQAPELLQRVFAVLKAIMSRTAYVELLVENPGAREQLVKLCAASSWIAHQLAHFPILLDELIDPQHLYQLPALDDYERLLNDYLVRIPEQDLEVQMDVLRQAKQALQLKIAAADISGAVPLMKVSDHLSALAEAVIALVVQLAWQQLQQKHGVPPGRNLEDTGFAVLAYGKLGGIELGYGSDLDLVFVCDADYQQQTDGARPLEVQQFYLRLAQRILHLFTTRTMSGVLYEVDLRLRPSGQAGLLVTQLDSYARYLKEDAWTWEQQALVRVRTVFGCRQLAERLKVIRAAMLQQPRQLKVLRQEILDMREKMREHLRPNQQRRPLATHGQTATEQFDLKQDAGGITDIEFIAQYLVLAHSHEQPSLTTYTDNIRVLTAAQEVGLLTLQQAQDLITAYQSLRAEAHQLALQEQPALTTNDFNAERRAVERIWQSLLLS